MGLRRQGSGPFKEYKWLLTSRGSGRRCWCWPLPGDGGTPHSALMLDILFSFNIALSIVVLLVAVYTRRPLGLPPSPRLADSHPAAARPQRGLHPGGAAGRPQRQRGGRAT